MRFKLLTLCLAMISVCALAEDGYHIIKKIPIPGQGGFD